MEIHCTSPKLFQDFCIKNPATALAIGNQQRQVLEASGHPDATDHTGAATGRRWNTGTWTIAETTMLQKMSQEGARWGQVRAPASTHRFECPAL